MINKPQQLKLLKSQWICSHEAVYAPKLRYTDEWKWLCHAFDSNKAVFL